MDISASYVSLPEGSLSFFFHLETHLYTYHPWGWYIYLHEWLIFMVGKYTSPMDASWVTHLYTPFHFPTLRSGLLTEEIFRRRVDVLNKAGGPPPVGEGIPVVVYPPLN